MKKFNERYVDKYLESDSQVEQKICNLQLTIIYFFLKTTETPCIYINYIYLYIYNILRARAFCDITI